MRALAVAFVFAFNAAAAAVDIPLHDPQVGRSHARGYDAEVASGRDAYLVTWGGMIQPSGDGSVHDVLYGRRFDAAGAPLDEQAFVIADRGSPSHGIVDQASVADGDVFFVATLTAFPNGRIAVYRVARDGAPELVSWIERRGEKSIDLVKVASGVALVTAGYDGIRISYLDGSTLTTPRQLWSANADAQIAAAVNASGEMAVLWSDPNRREMRYGLVDANGAARPDLPLAAVSFLALPEVASKGNDFFAVWFDGEHSIYAMRIGAQLQGPLLLADASYTKPSVTVRGNDYLVAYRGSGGALELMAVNSQWMGAPALQPLYPQYLTDDGIIAQGALGLFMTWWSFGELRADFRSHDGEWRYQAQSGLPIPRTREAQIPLDSAYCGGSTYIAWTAANHEHVALTRIGAQTMETVVLEDHQMYAPRDVQLSCGGGRLLALWKPESYVAYRAQIFRAGTLELERDTRFLDLVSRSDDKVYVPFGEPSVVWNGKSWTIAHGYTNEGIALRELTTAGDFGMRILLPRPELFEVPYGTVQLAWDGREYTLLSVALNGVYLSTLSENLFEIGSPRKISEHANAAVAPGLLVIQDSAKTYFSRIGSDEAIDIPFATNDAIPGVVATRDGWAVWQGNELALVSREGVLTRISAVTEPGAPIYSVAFDEAGTPRFVFTRSEGADSIPRAFLRLPTAGRRRAL